MVNYLTETPNKNFKESPKDAYLYLSIETLKKLATNIQLDIKKNKLSITESWNSNLIFINEVSRINSLYFAIHLFDLRINKLKNNNKYDEKLLNVLEKLYILFIYSNIEKDLKYFLEYNYFNSNDNQIDELKENIKKLVKELREQSIGLVDSFNHPDWVLKAP
jgi:hypothetical protein